MFRQMSRCVSAPALFRNSKAAAASSNNIARSFWLRPPISPFGREIERTMQELSHDFDRVVNSSFLRPFISHQHPFDIETYQFRNPIVEENGVKKFKLQFDIRRCKPEDVKVSTDAKKRTVTIEAKGSDESSNFQSQQTFTVPEGVTPADITCTYKSDGVLLLEAPYVGAEKTEPVKISIDHK